MADLLPSTPDTSAVERADPRVVGVDSDDADELLSALSSMTARELLAALHDDPANPAALADRVDTSLQNAQYHLSNMEEAGLIEVVDTVYSEKGREMNVYAASDRPLVVYAGKEEETSGLRTALSRLLGAVAALAVSSVVVQSLFGGGWSPFGVGSPPPADEQGPVVAENASTGSPTAEPTGVESTPVATPTEADEAGTFVVEQTAEATPTEVATEAARTATETAAATPAPEGAEVAAGLPPGLLFFAGGLLVLGVLVAWQRRR
ncbi:MAG: winged helix-turn-helix domain-containing protein [Halobacteriales archaeon]